MELTNVRQPARSLYAHRVLRGAILLCLVIFVVVLTSTLWLPAIGHWLAYPTLPHTADVIAVYGGARKRTLYGVERYQQGLAPRIWHTGYASYRESTMKMMTVRGLPASHITYLVTDSTWEDGQAIAAQARQQHIDSMLLITDWWHSRRAMCALSHHLNGGDIVLYFDAAPGETFGPDTWWQHAAGRKAVLSELAKLVAYWFLYGQIPWQC